MTHRHAGKTVACVHDLQRAALSCTNVRPRFAYLAPFMKQAKAVAWDYLRAATRTKLVVLAEKWQRLAEAPQVDFDGILAVFNERQMSGHYVASVGRRIRVPADQLILAPRWTW